MKIIDVLIERKSSSLNTPFSYLYDGEEDIKKGMRVYISFNSSKLVGFVINVRDTNLNKEELEQDSDFRYQYIESIIDKEPLLNEELLELSTFLSKEYLMSQIGVLQSMLPPTLKPKSSFSNKPKISYVEYVRVTKYDINNLNKREIELLDFINSHEVVEKNKITKKNTLKSLLEKELINIIKEEKYRTKSNKLFDKESYPLTIEQNKAYEDIINSSKNVIVLHGVTGSGKTQVYLALCKEALKNNQSTLILVPEISLTPMMIDYFKNSFDCNIAILHSKLSDAEKYDEYRKIKNNDVKIVIGTRSAIFAPINNIAYIIIDEEHSDTYKQESIPFYDARSIAIIRSKYHKAKVILGSASPSLYSMARAKKGVYDLVKLTNRYQNIKLPDVKIIDLAMTSNLSNESSMFSKQLIDAIKQSLSHKKQILLLINKRGYSHTYSCRECGHIFRCPNCDIPLIYHQNSSTLRCHHCGYSIAKPTSCPICESPYFLTDGIGTQKIEQEVNKIFPSAKTIRLDSDTGKNNKDIHKILSSFSKHDIDILIGTQMIAKGHDFPDVNLVGVVLADIGLKVPSYHSNEKVFQLILQAVGRGGREYGDGKAIVQTYLPKNHAVVYGSQQNYDKFYEGEMKIRKITQYPPFVNLIKLSMSGKNLDSLNKVCKTIYINLKNLKLEDVTILGPCNEDEFYKNNKFRRVIFIKYKKDDSIYTHLNKIINVFKKSQIEIGININP